MLLSSEDTAGLSWEVWHFLHKLFLLRYSAAIFKMWCFLLFLVYDVITFAVIDNVIDKLSFCQYLVVCCYFLKITNATLFCIDDLKGIIMAYRMFWPNYLFEIETATCGFTTIPYKI